MTGLSCPRCGDLCDIDDVICPNCDASLFEAWTKAMQARTALAAKARQAVQYAIKKGALTRGPCAHQGCCRGQIEAHHEDYAQPLDVVWLCLKHHRDLHAERGAYQVPRLLWHSSRAAA